MFTAFTKVAVSSLLSPVRTPQMVLSVVSGGFYRWRQIMHQLNKLVKVVQHGELCKNKHSAGCLGASFFEDQYRAFR